MSGQFTAKYHGRCACCEERIEPGDDVGYEDGALVCASCYVGDPAPARRETVCPSCWLVHPGSCEDAR